jgi:hypothetical protein
MIDADDADARDVAGEPDRADSGRHHRRSPDRRQVNAAVPW